MGNEETFPIKIFCFGNQNNILQKIFPDKMESKEDNFEHRRLKKSESFKENETNKTLSKKIEWNATLYPDITDDNIEELFEDLEKKMDIPNEEFDEKKIEKDKNDKKAREKTKNVIIKFGKKNSFYLINYMNDIPKTHLPQIAIVTNEDFDEKEEGLNDNRYLTIIKDKIKENLIKYLWEKECYYNERGTVILNTIDKIETNNYINIMLTGISRSGKSTLINVLSEKLVTLESPFLESVTNRIREYKVITSENGDFLTGLRFFDTPGLTVIKNNSFFGSDRNTINEVISAINAKIDECNDSREDIHLIYFMLKSYTNLENYVDFFNYIIQINKDREKEGKKKIYMIFIFNQGNEASEISLLEFLKDNNLDDLIEKIDENKEANKLSFKDRYQKKNSVKAEKKSKFNIVLLNLLKDEKSGKNVYGIDILLKLTLYFIRKDNPSFSKNDFDPLIVYKQKLTNADINENDRKEIEDNIKKIYKILSDENSFFSNIKNFDSIIANVHYYNLILKLSFLIIFRLFFFLFGPENIKISSFIYTFKKIANNYKIYTDEIMLKPLLNTDNKTLIGFDFVNSNTENEQSKKKIKDNLNLLEKKSDSIIINNDLFINGKSYKNDGFLNNIFYNVVVEYFDNYLEKTYCIDYVCKQKAIYDNIFKQLEKKAEKNDWDKFHPQEFKNIINKNY